jgi:hypothetical protein
MHLRDYSARRPIRLNVCVFGSDAIPPRAIQSFEFSTFSTEGLFITRSYEVLRASWRVFRTGKIARKSPLFILMHKRERRPGRSHSPCLTI